MALLVAGISYYAVLPRQIDLEIESIVKTSPATSAPVAAAGPTREAPVATEPAAAVQGSAQKPVSTRAAAPLAVSIVPLNETTAIQRINEVMSGQGELRNMKFSDTERQLSGALSAQELLTFFGRMGEVAKVRYDRKRFKSFPADQQVPFVLTLKAAALRTVEKPRPAPHSVQSVETRSPAVTAAPAPLATAPATSTSTVR
jgi:hypothetical protein